MVMSASAAGQRSSRGYEPEHIVVATPDVPAVQAELTDLGIGQRTIDHSEELDLTLLELPGLVDQAAGLRADAYLAAAAPAALEDDLDLLMFALRTRFSFRFRGWMPTMGKNRFLE